MRHKKHSPAGLDAVARNAEVTIIKSTAKPDIEILHNNNMTQEAVDTAVTHLPALMP
jgi:hypothetical protein